MYKEAQLVTVRRKLKETGEVSRNWALERYITRLSAIIQILEARGWGFKTEFRPYKKQNGTKGKDYVYVVKYRPSEEDFYSRPSPEEVRQTDAGDRASEQPQVPSLREGNPSDAPLRSQIGLFET